MVADAHQSAEEVQNGVEINHPQSDIASRQPKLIECQCHHRCGEELEKSFHPQVDNPETPGIDHRKVGLGTKEQRRNIEDWNCQRGNQEHLDNRLDCWLRQCMWSHQYP